MPCEPWRRKRPSNVPIEPFYGDHYGDYRGYRRWGRDRYYNYPYDPVVVQQPPVIIQTPPTSTPTPQTPLPQDNNLERLFREPAFISGSCFCMFVIIALLYLLYSKK